MYPRKSPTVFLILLLILRCKDLLLCISFLSFPFFSLCDHNSNNVFTLPCLCSISNCIKWIISFYLETKQNLLFSLQNDLSLFHFYDLLRRCNSKIRTTSFSFFFVMNFSRQIQDTIETIFILYIFTVAQNKMEKLICIYVKMNPSKIPNFRLTN